MLKTYMRLLGFAKPISRYAVPYFFFAALHATDGKPVEDAEAPADNNTDTNTTKWRILYSGPVVDDNLPWRTYLTNRTYSTNQGYL